MYSIILFIHILAGSIGLLSGTFTLVRKKGNLLHKKTGKVFFYSMLIVSLSAFILSYLHPNYFLFIVGVFTLYMNTTGVRYLQLKNFTQKTTIIDWFLSSFMLIFGLIFLVFGSILIVKGSLFGIVFILFGGIALRFVYFDFKNYAGKSKVKRAGEMGHIQRMIGTYIASLTAFLVVNLTSDLIPANLTFIPWILPTVILTPLIVTWTKKYKAK